MTPHVPVIVVGERIKRDAASVRRPTGRPLNGTWAMRAAAAHSVGRATQISDVSPAPVERMRGVGHRRTAAHPPLGSGTNHPSCGMVRFNAINVRITPPTVATPAGRAMVLSLAQRHRTLRPRSALVGGCLQRLSPETKHRVRVIFISHGLSVSSPCDSTKVERAFGHLSRQRQNLPIGVIAASEFNHVDIAPAPIPGGAGAAA